MSTRRDGYVFKLGSAGLGYYLDGAGRPQAAGGKPAKLAAMLAAIEAEEVARKERKKRKREKKERRREKKEKKKKERRRSEASDEEVPCAAARPLPHRPPRPTPSVDRQKAKNSQAWTGHQRGMDGRGTDDDDTHERHTDTHKLTRHSASWAPTHHE